jgi:hypothetical protein
MTDTHYWVGEGTAFTCNSCKTSLSINLDFFGGQYNKSFTYYYPNGDKSTVFVRNLKDICPVKQDIGKGIPGAQIPLKLLILK